MQKSLSSLDISSPSIMLRRIILIISFLLLPLSVYLISLILYLTQISWVSLSLWCQVLSFKLFIFFILSLLLWLPQHVRLAILLLHALFVLLLNIIRWIWISYSHIMWLLCIVSLLLRKLLLILGFLFGGLALSQLRIQQLQSVLILLMIWLFTIILKGLPIMLLWRHLAISMTIYLYMPLIYSI